MFAALVIRLPAASISPHPELTIAGWKGNMLDYKQFSADVGAPLSVARGGLQGEGCANVFWRFFSGAVVYVNPKPVGHADIACSLDLNSGWEYSRLDGSKFTGEAKVGPASAIVLLRRPAT